MKLRKIWLLICVLVLALLAFGCNTGGNKNQKLPAPVRPKTKMTRPLTPTPSSGKQKGTTSGKQSSPGTSKQGQTKTGSQ